MKRILLVFFGLIFAGSVCFSQTPLMVQSQQVPETRPSQKIDHSVFGDLLKRYVDKQGLFNYRALKEDKRRLAVLDAYVEDLSKIDGTELEVAAERMAYWLNLYNALVIREVLKVYPVKSVSEIKHFFDEPRYQIAGFPEKKLSLIDIEQFFRDRFNDPRLNLARVNASLSGPLLLSEAYDSEKLDFQLETVTLMFLKDSHKNQYDAARSIFYISPIFLWFEIDFKRFSVSYREFIGRRLPEFQNVRMVFKGYDWKLNDIKNRW